MALGVLLDHGDSNCLQEALAKISAVRMGTFKVLPSPAPLAMQEVIDGDRADVESSRAISPTLR